MKRHTDNLVRWFKDQQFFNRHRPISESETRDIKIMLTKLVNMESLRMYDLSRLISEVQATKDYVRKLVADGFGNSAKIAELTKEKEELLGVKAALEAKAVEDQAMLDNLAAELAALRDTGASMGGVA